MDASEREINHDLSQNTNAFVLTSVGTLSINLGKIFFGYNKKSNAESDRAHERMICAGGQKPNAHDPRNAKESREQRRPTPLQEKHRQASREAGMQHRGQSVHSRAMAPLSKQRDRQRAPPPKTAGVRTLHPTPRAHTSLTQQ